MIYDDTVVGEQRERPSRNEPVEQLMLELAEIERKLARLNAAREEARTATSSKLLLASAMVEAVRSLTLFLVKALRFSLNTALGASFYGFLILFGLQFLPHPAKWDSWAWVVALRNIARPFLTVVDSVLEWPEAVPFYPLALAFTCLGMQLFTDSKLGGVCRWLEKKPPRHATGEMEDRNRTMPFGGGSILDQRRELLNTH